MQKIKMKNILIIVIILLVAACVGSTSQKNNTTKGQQNESIEIKSETNTTYKHPEDVTTKIRKEYSNPDHQEFIINSLVKLSVDWEFKSARIPRCILFLSKGDFEAFKENLKNAETDWRDVIYWAEYNSEDNQIYNFNKTFEENGL